VVVLVEDGAVGSTKEFGSEDEGFRETDMCFEREKEFVIFANRSEVEDRFQVAASRH
jgi:hypothetical protein